MRLGRLGERDGAGARAKHRVTVARIVVATRRTSVGPVEHDGVALGIVFGVHVVGAVCLVTLFGDDALLVVALRDAVTSAAVHLVAALDYAALGVSSHHIVSFMHLELFTSNKLIYLCLEQFKPHEHSCTYLPKRLQMFSLSLGKRFQL